MMDIKLDDGFQFGWGAFETVAVEKNRLLFLKAHLARLSEALSFLRIERNVTEAEVFSYIQQYHMDHHVLKIMVSHENTVFLQRPNPYDKTQWQRGFSLDYSPVRRNETSPFVYHKTLNYGECLLEKRRAAKNGLDDFLFLNARGEICETTSANIFFVKNERLYTPPTASGLLNGIIRDYICGNRPVTERVIRQIDVGGFEECFLTNSLMGIMPVSRLGDVRFHKRAAAHGLMAEYQREILNPPTGAD